MPWRRWSSSDSRPETEKLRPPWRPTWKRPLPASKPRSQRLIGETYYELDQTFFSVTSVTFIGHLFARLGMVNIADPADPDGFGFPQLSPEFIIEQDPDVVFLADTKCCGQTAATVAERPGWDQLRAVQRGSVVELDDDIASRWGPRIVNLMRAAADAVLALET